MQPHNFNNFYLGLCAGDTVPYHITQPSTNHYVQTIFLPTTVTTADITCSLNITIPSSVTVTWLYDGNVTLSSSNQTIQSGDSTTLLIENPQLSDAGVYQCIFNDTYTSGWILKRNTTLEILSKQLASQLNVSYTTR